MNYQITCCSTIDMDESFIRDNHLLYTPFHFTMDDQEFTDDLGASYPASRFFEDVIKADKVSTSQVSVGQYVRFFEPILKEGKDVLHITLSSGISGTYNSAVLAASDLNFRYENKVHVIDSLAASGGYGLLVKLAVDNQNKGMSIEENFEYLQEHKLNVNHLFYTMDLTMLIKGGRVSAAAGNFANALNICPFMYVDKIGKLEVRKKCMGKRRAMMEAIKTMLATADNGAEYDGYVYITNSNCLGDATALKDEILKHFKNVKEVKITSIGAVIGSHTGPGTVALFFTGAKRID